jgi:anaerobic selenocysteine-containing dehydrogenase
MGDEHTEPDRGNEIEGEAMTDRIANPWGERTPFGPGEEWPVRVDQFLEDGVSEDEVDRWVQTASLHHANGDALDLAVKDERIVGVRGRAADRVNRGRLDPKDLFVWQAYNSPDRLTRPLVRDNGELVEASWDEAMGRIVERSQELLEEKGPLAFGFYTSGQLFLEDYYTLGEIGKAGLGTPHMDGNTRLCTATAAVALEPELSLVMSRKAVRVRSSALHLERFASKT